jgi:hypothetical protein
VDGSNNYEGKKDDKMGNEEMYECIPEIWDEEESFSQNL